MRDFLINRLSLRNLFRGEISTWGQGKTLKDFQDAMVPGHFSQESVDWLVENYPEYVDTVLYDFTTCQRPNGSFYGTSGTCRKGTEVEQRREESIKHLNNSIATLREKREQLPQSGRGRIDRLIDKLETDLKAIQGDAKSASTSRYRPSSPKPEDRSTMKPEKSRNEDYGFYGTSKEKYSKEVGKRWEQASKGLQSQGLTPPVARRMLDSSWGRHLADRLEGVPSEKVGFTVKQILESQSPRQKREFEKLWNSLLSDEWDD